MYISPNSILPVAIEQVSLQCCTRLFLGISRSFGFIFIIPVTIIPGATVRFPRPQTYPTEVCFTVLVFTHHMITTTILLYCCIAFRALLCISGYPIRRLRIIVTFLDPFLKQLTPYRVMPVLTTHETKDVTTTASYRFRIDISYLKQIDHVDDTRNKASQYFFQLVLY